MQGARLNPKTGHHSTHRYRHSIRPHGKRQGGGTPTRRRGTPTFDGESVTLPPLLSPCHPPSATPPALSRWPHPPPRRGGSGQRIPHHTNSADTRTLTRTPQHLAKNSARHDSSTRQRCSGMSRARAAPLHWAGQQQRTPPPFRTPRRMDTIHSSTHLLSLIHVHTTNERS